MDTFGKVKRDITALDSTVTKIYPHGEHGYYYEASIIDDDGIDMLYIRVSHRGTPDEKYGKHFNAEWMTEEQQDWLAHIIGELLCETVRFSRNRAQEEIREHMSKAFQLMGFGGPLR